MNALISGQAGIAVMIDGITVSAINVDAPDLVKSYHQTTIPYLFAGASDVIELRAITKELVVSKLKEVWQNDRCLQLILILLSDMEDIENRELAVSCLQELLMNNSSYDFVRNRLYSAPLPQSTDLVGSAILVEGTPKLESLLDDLDRDQELIYKYYQSLIGLPNELFGGIAEKKIFEEAVFNFGIIREFVNAGSDSAHFGLARVQFQHKLSYLRNSRQIFSEWLKGLSPKRKIGDVKDLVEDESIYESNELTSNYIRYKQKSSLNAYENVKKQKMAIIPLLKSGNLSRMRTYVDQLVKYQLVNGDPKYPAMSLCDLSQKAKAVSNHSLQLELAQYAVDIAPKDARAHCHVADAYYSLSQYDDSLKWFKLAETLGEEIYARSGYARVLRKKGKLDEALIIYKQAIVDFPTESIFWNGVSEVLREMWRLDDALKAYEEAIREFPTEIIPRTGKASVLKDIGLLDESLIAYRDIKNTFGDNEYTINGQADVLREMGKYEEALELYTEAIRIFPNDVVPYCGRAQVLKEMCRTEEALREYENAIAAFPYQAIPCFGRAGVLKETGRYDDAISAYDDAINRFPYDTHAYNGKAGLLKKIGKYSDSLQLYDKVLVDFPYDIIAMKGRSEILKESGQLEDAIEAYDRVIIRDPKNKSLVYSKAAVLVAMGRFEEALSMLPDGKPRTREEWVAFHIRGMIYLKSKNIERAIELFKYGLDNIPFANERIYFGNALVVAALKKNEYDEAVKYISNIHEPINDIFRIHTYGSMNRIDETIESFNRIEDNCPPNIVQLRDELAFRFSLKKGIPQKTWEWVFEQECRVVLLEAA